LGTLVAFLVVGAVPVSTPDNLLTFFLSGAVAISAMILPGISGSFILVVLGKYEQVLGTLVSLISSSVNLVLGRWSEISWTQYQSDILLVSFFSLGCVIGLALFSRALTWLFAKHHDIAVATLLGVMIGSLRKIWPWKEVLSTRVDRHGDIVPLLEHNVLPALDGALFLSLGLIVAGIALILLLDTYSVTQEHVHDINDPAFIAERKVALISQEHTLVNKVKRFFSRS
jgi:putative membrane protein